MNILVLNYEYPPIGGGGALVTKDIAEALAARGHSVTIVTMGFGALSAYEEIQGVEVHRLPCWRSKAAVCHPWEQLTYIFAAKRFLRKLLKTRSFDVCHAHFIIPTGVIALGLKRKAGVPYVLTTHGSDVPGYNQRRFMLLHKLLRPFWKSICGGAGAITTPSAFLYDLIQESDPAAARRCEIVPNGIDTAAYRSGPKENIILTMSRLQPHKGVQRLLAAFARIPHHDGWSVHIAGDGPYRGELEALTQRLGLSGSVVFHGWIKNKSEEHIRLLAKARILVSASDFESFDVSAAEAAASDCRLILSDIQAHSYFEQFGARFFPPEDIPALETRLREAMALPEAPIPGKGALSMSHMADSLERILASVQTAAPGGERT